MTNELQPAAGQELEKLVESPTINRLLLKNARKPYAEIARLTGVPVGEVAERLEVLLTSPDVRTDLMEERLLLEEVAILVDDIRERMARTNVEDEGWASMARVQLQALKTMLEQLDKRRKAVDGKLATISMEQAQLFAAAIQLTKERAIFEIEKKYPSTDVEIIHAEFDLALPGAIEYLESKTHAK